MHCRARRCLPEVARALLRRPPAGRRGPLRGRRVGASRDAAHGAQLRLAALRRHRADQPRHAPPETRSAGRRRIAPPRGFAGTRAVRTQAFPGACTMRAVHCPSCGGRRASKPMSRRAMPREPSLFSNEPARSMAKASPPTRSAWHFWRLVASTKLGHCSSALWGPACRRSMSRRNSISPGCT